MLQKQGRNIKTCQTIKNLEFTTNRQPTKSYSSILDIFQEERKWSEREDDSKDIGKYIVKSK